MASTRFTQQHIIELNEKPASSLLMNKELQNIYKGTNELDDEAKIHRAKQADPTLADTAPEKHVTNAQAKKWDDIANTFSGVSPSSFVAATEVVTTATANKILKLNADGKLPTDIVGNATTASDSLLLNGKSDTAFQEVAEKDQPGGYAGLDATGKIPGELLNITVIPVGAIITYPVDSIPSHCLECNGATISRETYSELFAAIGTTYGEGDGSTTFKIPDLRGEFIRGWDNARGIDASRAIGSAQADAFKAHTHDYSYVGGSGSHEIMGGATYPRLLTSTSSTGGTETRPRNVAMMYCIVYE